MSTVDIDPNNIRYENGRLIAPWPNVVVSRSMAHYGRRTVNEEKAIIPAEFAPVIDEAKKQNRQVRITYKSILGPQTASDVQII